MIAMTSQLVPISIILQVLLTSINLSSLNMFNFFLVFSMPFFIFGDFILHTMPLLLVYFKYWREAVEIITHSKIKNQAYTYTLVEYSNHDPPCNHEYALHFIKYFQ